jgi:hypothetical protein
LFGLQPAFTFCAFGFGALGFNRSVARGLLRPFGLRAFFSALSISRVVLIPLRSAARVARAVSRFANAGSAILARNFSNASFLALAAASWRSMKSGCLKPAIYFRPCISILHSLPRLGGLNCVQLPSTHAPADDRRFDWAAGIHTVPSTATPSAQKRNDVGADVILAEKFKRLVRRRNTFVTEGLDSLSPCRHAVSIIPVVINLMRRYGAAMASRRAYITPTSA